MNRENICDPIRGCVTWEPPGVLSAVYNTPPCEDSGSSSGKEGREVLYHFTDPTESSLKELLDSDLTLVPLLPFWDKVGLIFSWEEHCVKQK